MIVLNDKDYEGILYQYYIPSDILSVEYLINGQELKNEVNRVKIITRVYLDNGDSYIVKIVKEAEHNVSVIEEQSIFSETLRKSGINTPIRYLNRNSQYTTEKQFNDLSCVITIEEDLGPIELEYINTQKVTEISRLLANMHIIAETKKCQIGYSTIWNLFDAESDIKRGFRDLKRLMAKYKNLQSNSKLKKILFEYKVITDSLQEIWDILPKYAIQGDISTNNFIVNSKTELLGIIDYNISGSEVLVSDMVIEGIFFCYIMDLDPNNKEERATLFNIFIMEYQRIRKLTSTELSCVNFIYSIVFPFMWDRIDSLEKMLKENDEAGIEAFLDETAYLMSTKIIL